VDQVLKDLYSVIEARKASPQEGSYTCYLFGQGRDKILKKMGEECAETIIAVKNQDHGETVNEVCDLMYHLMVMLANEGIPLEDVLEQLSARSAKIGNLKQMKQTDRNT